MNTLTGSECDDAINIAPKCVYFSERRSRYTTGKIKVSALSTLVVNERDNVMHARALK